MAKKKTGEKNNVTLNIIRDDLLEQLERNGAFGKHYVDMVDDYCKYYEIKEMLYEDIAKRGVQCKYNNGGGQSGYKKNESIAEMNKTTVTMLKILSELGLKAPVTKSDGGEPDDLL